jgi:hypothetical protein
MLVNDARRGWMTMAGVRVFLLNLLPKLHLRQKENRSPAAKNQSAPR